MGLSACGGGGGGSLSGDDSGGTGGTSGSEGDSEELPTVTIGAYIGQTFTAGILKITVSSISSGGTTDVTAFLVDENNDPIEEDVIDGVLFSSSCISQGTASITTPTITVSPGITTAVTTYTAADCEGDDTITAEAILDNTTLSSATGTITIAPQTAGSLEFIPPAEPITLTIQGAGGTETADVKFQVLSADGDPVAGESVSFEVATPILGGLSISPTSIESDDDGYVATAVVSGTIPTTVVVVATLDSNNTISTSSNSLAISTGLPNQKGFGIVLSEYNIEAATHTGVTVDITAYASDNYATAALDGTIITFVAEAGQVQPATCTIQDGECTTTWKSTTDHPADNRITILGFTEGQETFTDINSSGLYDDLAEFDAINDDMPEAWLDVNENDTYDVGEIFWDTGIINGTYDSGDGIFNGFQCNHASCESEPKSIHVRDWVTLAESSSTASIAVTDISPLTTVVGGETCILLNAANPLSTIIFTVIGSNGQQMPGDTTVAVSTINQGTATLISGKTPWPSNTTSETPVEFKATIEGDGEIGSGTFKVTVTSGKYSETTEHNVCIVEE